MFDIVKVNQIMNQSKNWVHTHPISQLPHIRELAFWKLQ